MKPLNVEVVHSTEDWDIVLKDRTSEADIKSSECISIEFDHLDKEPESLELSLKDWYIYDDSGGSISSEDLTRIKLKTVKI